MTNKFALSLAVAGLLWATSGLAALAENTQNEPANNGAQPTSTQNAAQNKDTQESIQSAIRQDESAQNAATQGENGVAQGSFWQGGVGQSAAENGTAKGKNGAFFGIQLGFARVSATSKLTATATNPTTGATASTSSSDPEEGRNGARFGFLAGYNQFFTDKFALRYYGTLDLGEYDGLNVYNFGANIDGLYELYAHEAAQMFAFGGMYLGYAKYDEADISGVDFGFNLGVQFKIQEHHNIDIYGRFGIAEQDKSETTSGTLLGANYTQTITYSLKQPYHFGFRYTFSF